MTQTDSRVQLSGSEDPEAAGEVIVPSGLTDSVVSDDEGEASSSDDEFTQEILRAIGEAYCSDDSNEENLAVESSSATNTAVHRPPEEQLFYVTYNTTKKFRVCRYKGASVPRWKDMELKSSVELQGVELRQGNLITVVVLGQNDAIAEIAEIRAVGDGRHLLRVFWFLERDTVIPKLDDADRAKFPAEFAYVKAAYTDVISWITTRGPLDDSLRAKILPDRILCYWKDKTISLEPRTAPYALWAQFRDTAGKIDSVRSCETQRCELGTVNSDGFGAFLPGK